MTASTASGKSRAGLKTNDQKWSTLLMDSGWMALPNVIVEHQRALGLDAVDINILLHLIRHWWQPDNLPHPSKRTIAECMSIDQSTVRRHLAKMERNGLVRRVARHDRTLGQKTNAYEFSGLIERSKTFAVEALRLREARKEEASRRRIRGKPRIVQLD